MKPFIFCFIFLLIIISGYSQQDQNSYRPWSHPILKQLAKNSKELVSFNNLDTSAFVSLTVIDKEKKLIYWFDRYGYYFSSLHLDKIDIEAICKKKVPPFKYFYLRSIDYINNLMIARNSIRTSGLHAKLNENYNRSWGLNNAKNFLLFYLN